MTQHSGRFQSPDLPLTTKPRLRRNCSPPLNVTTKEKLNVCVVNTETIPLFFSSEGNVPAAENF